MTLSEEMLDFRVRHNLSQNKAADLAGIALQTWAHVERSIQDPSRLTEGKIRKLIKDTEMGNSNEIKH